MDSFDCRVTFFKQNAIDKTTVYLILRYFWTTLLLFLSLSHVQSSYHYRWTACTAPGGCGIFCFYGKMPFTCSKNISQNLVDKVFLLSYAKNTHLRYIIYQPCAIRHFKTPIKSLQCLSVWRSIGSSYALGWCLLWFLQLNCGQFQFFHCPAYDREHQGNNFLGVLYSCGEIEVSSH